MQSRSENIDYMVRTLLIATFVLVPIIPESVLADPSSRPSFSPYRSLSYTSPLFPNYTHQSQSNHYSVGGYSRHTYKYKDSFGNRYKSKTQMLPSGTTVTRGKYRSSFPSLPNYTYKSQSKSYRVGGYSRHTYKYKDSLGNRHKGTIEVFPGGTVRHKGKVNGRKFKEMSRNK